MSEEKGVRWLCHRCAKKEGVTTDTEPILRVCDGCKIENWVRPVRGAPVIVEEVKESLPIEEVQEETVPEEAVEPTEAEAVAVEPEDPYQGMTNEELKAELAKRG